jgi:hypothetical protein
VKKNRGLNHQKSHNAILKTIKSFIANEEIYFTYLNQIFRKSSSTKSITLPFGNISSLTISFLRHNHKSRSEKKGEASCTG